MDLLSVEAMPRVEDEQLDQSRRLPKVPRSLTHSARPDPNAKTSQESHANREGAI
jgi:hypothetical protein